MLSFKNYIEESLEIPKNRDDVWIPAASVDGRKTYYSPNRFQRWMLKYVDQEGIPVFDNEKDCEDWCKNHKYPYDPKSESEWEEWVEEARHGEIKVGDYVKFWDKNKFPEQTHHRVVDVTYNRYHDSNVITLIIDGEYKTYFESSFDVVKDDREDEPEDSNMEEWVEE